VAQVRSTFESGTLGAVIQVGDDAFTQVDGSPVYDNTHAFAGSQAAKFSTDPGGLDWDSTTAIGAVNDVYGEMYVWFEAAQGVANGHLYVSNSVVFSSAGITILNNFKIRVDDNIGTSSTSTTALPTGQWNRLLIRCVAESVDMAGDGTVTCSIYTTGDLMTPDETVTLSNCFTGPGPFNLYRSDVGVAAGHGVWVDNLRWYTLSAEPGIYAVSRDKLNPRRWTPTWYGAGDTRGHPS